MGQHKLNPMAEKAKQGALPPKKKKMSKKQRDDIFATAIYNRMMQNLFKFGTFM